MFNVVLSQFSQIIYKLDWRCCVAFVGVLLITRANPSFARRGLSRQAPFTLGLLEEWLLKGFAAGHPLRKDFWGHNVLQNRTCSLQFEPISARSRPEILCESIY